MTALAQCQCTTYGDCQVCRPHIDPATFRKPRQLEDLVLLSEIFSQSMVGWRKRRALRRFASRLNVHEADLLFALKDFLFEIDDRVTS